MNEIWSFEHSVDCPVPRSVAWQFWTHVENWKLDADVEAVELNGPFAAGSNGATMTRSGGRVEWRITEVQPGMAALIEVPFPQGIGRFHWTFEDLGAITRIKQRISLSGETSPLIEEIARGMEAGVPAGMQKLCSVMTGSAASQATASSE